MNSFGMTTPDSAALTASERNNGETPAAPKKNGTITLPIDDDTLWRLFLLTTVLANVITLINLARK